MAKKEERNVNVTIKSEQEEKDEVVISISSIFKMLKKYFLPWIIIAVMFGAMTVATNVNSALKVKPPLTALVSFTYDGIEKGLDPNGKTFDVNTLKNPDIIKNALNELDIDVEKVESVRRNISIAGIIPPDAIDRITAYSGVMRQATNGNLSAAQALLDTSYYPTQYKVTFKYAGTGLSKADAVQVLNTTLSEYRTYFYKQYGFNQSLGAAATTLNYKDYDFPEAVDLFKATLTTLEKYAKDLADEDVTRFRSSAGYTFEDIYESVKTIEELDLEKTEAFLQANNITRDKQESINYYTYMIEKLNRDKAKYEESLAAVKAAKESYKKDTIVVMQEGTDDVGTEMTKTSAAYDKLIDQEVQVANDLAETKQEISIYTARKAALEKAGNTSDAKIAEFDEKLAALNTKVGNIVEISKKTADEYFENVEFANAYSILVPAVNSGDVDVKLLIKNSVRGIVLKEAFIFFIYFGIAFVSALIYENSKKKKEERLALAEGKKKASKGGDDDDDDDDNDDDDEEIDEIIDEVIDAVADKPAETPKKNNKQKNNKRK